MLSHRLPTGPRTTPPSLLLAREAAPLDVRRKPHAHARSFLLQLTPHTFFLPVPRETRSGSRGRHPHLKDRVHAEAHVRVARPEPGRRAVPTSTGRLLCLPYGDSTTGHRPASWARLPYALHTVPSAVPAHAGLVRPEAGSQEAHHFYHQ